MQIKANSVEDYLNQLPNERKTVMEDLLKTLRNNLPEGFEECISYGMIGFVVPKELYPAGYHCDPKLPLPFLSIASQKNFIAFYHMGIYADKQLHDWFVEEYPKHTKYNLDMGKSCVRFKKIDDIPLDLIAQTVQKMTPQQWISLYEQEIKR